MMKRGADPRPVRVKPLIMDALPWRVWKHVAFPIWLRWYKWWQRSARWQSGLYDVGSVAYWRGVKLVCCRRHFAGYLAEHPWDPGAGWDAQVAAALWEPARARDRLLLRLVGDPRVREDEC